MLLVCAILHITAAIQLTRMSWAARPIRLFKDTVKGGDFRAREANVYRLAQNTTFDHAEATLPAI